MSLMTKSIDLLEHFNAFTSKIYETPQISNLKNTDSLYYILVNHFNLKISKEY